jgi:ATP synthase protein I
MRQFAVVMELPFHLVAATIVGGLLGLLLDRWLGTAPWLMVLVGAVGFGVGVRDVMLRLKMTEKRRDGDAGR